MAKRLTEVMIERTRKGKRNEKNRRRQGDEDLVAVLKAVRNQRG